ncbi:putative pectinesterase/pectinesterase inhibitor 13 [Wolffia australiana]
MGLGKKIFVFALTLVALAAIIVGIVVAVAHAHRKIGDDISGPSSNGGTATSSKSIQAMCAVTDYKDACEKSLSAAVGGNGNAVSIKAIVKAAVEVTLNASKSAADQVLGVSGNSTVDDRQKAALSDCKQLLQDAVDELQDIFSGVDLSVDKNLTAKSDDVKTWLSAVISYQQTCLDGVDHPELKAQLEKIISDAAELTSNALAIVTEVASTLQSLGALQIPQVPSRRLLSDYPEWFSESDRRLLAAAAKGNVKPDAVVAKDGSGQFKTINAALNAIPKDHKGRYVIYVKAGVYQENVIVTKNMENVFMYGDGARRSIVSGRKNFVDGTPTFQTATFAAIGSGFVAKSMGFANTAGPEKHQAVALRVQSDMAAFFNCRMDGYQDTLYVQTHRQFYRNCVISGTVDFIFGDSATVLQNCLIIVRKPLDNQQNTITAHGRTDKRETTGLVIHNCRIVPEAKLVPLKFKIPSYLGRPWKEYSRTVIMESTIGDFIRPEGWLPWAGDFALKTLYYAEYGNRGAGAKTSGRVKWPGFRVIGKKEAAQFTVGPFLQGDRWIGATGAPFIVGFRN